MSFLFASALAAQGLKNGTQAVYAGIAESTAAPFVNIGRDPVTNQVLASNPAGDTFVWTPPSTWSLVTTASAGIRAPNTPITAIGTNLLPTFGLVGVFSNSLVQPPVFDARLLDRTANPPFWRSLGATAPPTWRSGFGFATLPNGDVILFGGFDVNLAALNETWRLDPALVRWQRLITATTPPGRMAPGMVGTNTGIVMFGGQSQVGATGPFLSDTWIFDGQNWSLPPQTFIPAGRSSPAMSFSAPANEVVMFGGSQNGTQLRSIHVFDLATRVWFDTPTLLPSSVNTLIGAAAFEPILREHIGPENGGSSTVAVGRDSFGTVSGTTTCNCPTLPLLLAAATRPAIGTAFGVSLVNQPTSGAFTIVAADTTLTAPTALNAFGFGPTCLMHVSPFAPAVAVVAAQDPVTGRMVASFLLPNTPSAVGGSLFFQGYDLTNGCMSLPAQAVLGR